MFDLRRLVLLQFMCLIKFTWFVSGKVHSLLFMLLYNITLLFARWNQRVFYSNNPYIVLRTDYHAMFLTWSFLPTISEETESGQTWKRSKISRSLRTSQLNMSPRKSIWVWKLSNNPRKISQIDVHVQRFDKSATYYSHCRSECNTSVHFNGNYICYKKTQ